MEFASMLGLPVMTILLYIVPTLIALMVIVFIHEYGHYKVARWCGIDIEAFSIGFGKEIAGWHDKYGTRWKLSWLPLGGYVKFRGDANAASFPDAETQAQAAGDPGNFHGKPVWQRAAVVAAGPVANFILAIVIFAGFFFFFGESVIAPKAGEVMPGSAAERAGIEAGDTFIEINGSPISSFQDIMRMIHSRAGEKVTLVVERDGGRLTINAVPDLKTESDGMGGKMRIGLLGIKPMVGAFRVQHYGPLEAVVHGTEEVWAIVTTTLRYIGKIFVGRENGDQLRGPAGIVQVAGYAFANGVDSFVAFIAFLSVSIGLINLFPIPMLDGGHLVYYAIEAVRGKPLGPMAQEWGFRIGFSVVIMLMLVGTWNDVVRFVSMALGG